MVIDEADAKAKLMPAAMEYFKDSQRFAQGDIRNKMRKPFEEVVCFNEWK